MNKLKHNQKVVEQLIRQAKRVANSELEPRDMYSQYFYLGFLKAYVQVLDTLRGYKLV